MPNGGGSTVPERVGPYELVRFLARGGYGTIHLARSVFSGQQVAIKRLHSQLAADEDASAMFLDESRVLSRISHPNVLRHLDAIQGEDELCLVMEYVEGATLRSLLKRTRRTEEQLGTSVALAIVRDALLGLQAAHDASGPEGEPLHVIHRDFTPDNILVGVDGIARLLDFGMSRAVGQYHVTDHNVIRGKLAYVSPEQITNSPQTQQSDLFSASVVLWEALTGKRLFRGKTISALAQAVVKQELVRPSDVAGTPAVLDAIVLRGLSREPKARWPSAQDMAAAIDATGLVATRDAVEQCVRVLADLPSDPPVGDDDATRA
jgi:serine/threonine-protein kinase